MTTHAEKTLKRIQSNPAPRDIEWNEFIMMWSEVADSVENESGDRLAVEMNGHREVFHRPHDARVSIEDVHRARHFLETKAQVKGQGTLLAVTIDAKGADFYNFNLDATDVDGTEREDHDEDPRGRHLRTVERHTGRDDVADLKHFLDQIGSQLDQLFQGEPFVVIGHGGGKSNVAEQFVERFKKEHPERAREIIDVVDLDLSAANPGDIENAAIRAARR